ncbi:hypothetical protein ACWCRD_02850 [Streptomyces sp. NPDC002092]
MGIRRESRRDDDQRTGRLLDHMDASYGHYSDPDFNDVVMDGLISDKAEAAAGRYPPAGHGYPKKG